MERPPSVKSDSSIGRTALVAAGVIVALLALGPIVAGLTGSRKAHLWLRLHLCQKNLESISYAVSGYAAAHGGHPPARLQQLVPRYLSEVPTCPAAGIDTYTGGYIVAGKRYTNYCLGHNHKPLAPANFPRFGAEVGSFTVRSVPWPGNQ